MEESLTFVVTKCDDVDRGELIENLGLNDDPEYLRIVEKREQEHQSGHLNANTESIAGDGQVESPSIVTGTGIVGNPEQSESSENNPGTHKRPLPDSSYDAELALKRIKLVLEPAELLHNLDSNNREIEDMALALNRKVNALCSRKRSEVSLLLTFYS